MSIKNLNNSKNHKLRLPIKENLMVQRCCFKGNFKATFRHPKIEKTIFLSMKGNLKGTQRDPKFKKIKKSFLKQYQNSTITGPEFKKINFVIYPCVKNVVKMWQKNQKFQNKPEQLNSESGAKLLQTCCKISIFSKMFTSNVDQMWTLCGPKIKKIKKSYPKWCKCGA